MKFSRKNDEYLVGKIEDATLLNIEKSIYNESFQFSDFKIIDKYLNLLEMDIHELLVLRKLNNNIKRLYKIKQADRNSIIKQVQVLLTETSKEIYITRLDIRNFYSSIDRNKILKKLLENDYLLSYHSKYLLQKLFFDHGQISNHAGLPFGLNLSATLSELYMRDFDKNIRNIDGVYYYARYVDDIIVFSYKNIDIQKTINEKKYLHSELKFNQDKCKTVLAHDRDFLLDFLGYKFEYENNSLSISISKNKINKIKSRIIHAFLDFFKRGDFTLLEKRIIFLTSNYIIYENENRKLKGGLSYNYNLINNYNVIQELDTFLVKTIFSKNGSFGKRNCLTKEQKEKLKKYTFHFGFHQKVLYKFSRQEHSSIKRCW